MSKSVGKSFGALLVGAVSAIYLINPTAGFLEIIPDNIPLIGNLDEATAALLVIGVLRYFGLDLTKAFSRQKLKRP